MRKSSNVLLVALLFMMVCFMGINSPYLYNSQMNNNASVSDLHARQLYKLIDKYQKTLDELVARKQTLDDNLPTIYVVTPTYQRAEQIPELTRLGQTLMNVPKIHWIVAEDAVKTNPLVLEFLDYIDITYTYLLTPMPAKYRESTNAKPRGVANRNAAIDWIRKNAKNGVMYLADDDNTYDIRLFEEIRYTKNVSMLPVGLVTEYGLSSPVLKDGRFVGWYDGWVANRKFPVDMAGFAISVHLLLSADKPEMPYVPGYEETGLLSTLKIDPENIEFVADNCTKIYVWHTKTHKNRPSKNNILHDKYNGTNLRQIQKFMIIKE